MTRGWYSLTSFYGLIGFSKMVYHGRTEKENLIRDF